MPRSSFRRSRGCAILLAFHHLDSRAHVRYQPHAIGRVLAFEKPRLFVWPRCFLIGRGAFRHFAWMSLRADLRRDDVFRAVLSDSVTGVASAYETGCKDDSLSKSHFVQCTGNRIAKPVVWSLCGGSRHPSGDAQGNRVAPRLASRIRARNRHALSQVNERAAA